jgi:hypothetical protein
MTKDQLHRILTAICDEHDGDPEESRPNIEINHGYGQYTVIDATFPAWEISDDGILTAHTSSGTRWITCESINSIGI